MQERALAVWPIELADGGLRLIEQRQHLAELPLEAAVAAICTMSRNARSQALHRARRPLGAALQYKLVEALQQDGRVTRARQQTSGIAPSTVLGGKICA